MTTNYWSDLYSGWGWFLWFGVLILIFSSFGNWGYTYRAHQLYRVGFADKDAIDILNERYAKGEIQREEYNRMKNEIQETRQSFSNSKNPNLTRPQTT
jgi:putative membrane protein